MGQDTQAIQVTQACRVIEVGQVDLTSQVHSDRIESLAHYNNYHKQVRKRGNIFQYIIIIIYKVTIVLCGRKAAEQAHAWHGNLFTQAN